MPSAGATIQARSEPRIVADAIRPSTIARQEAVTRLLAVAGRIRRELEAVCDAHGLTYDQFHVLRLIREGPTQGLARGSIETRLRERSPDVTRLLDRLVRQGLVGRHRSREDRRLSLARVTDRGLRVVEEIDRKTRAVQAHYGSLLEPSELAALDRACRLLMEEESDPVRRSEREAAEVDADPEGSVGEAPPPPPQRGGVPRSTGVRRRGRRRAPGPETRH